MTSPARTGGHVYTQTGGGVAGAHAGGTVKLKRPATRKLDDSFYRAFLRAYDEAAESRAAVHAHAGRASGAPRNTVARGSRRRASARSAEPRPTSSEGSA